MNDIDRQKLYASYADISRRWTATMDSKGAFFSALNAGILAFLWGSLKVENWTGIERYFCKGATGASLLALGCALIAVAPREKLSTLVGRKSPWTPTFKPLSFYGYVAKHYGKDGLREMVNDFRVLDEAGFAYEALEQHFSISLVIQRKSNWVYRAAACTVSSIALVGVALFLRLG
jgi:hypothetical protein